MCAHSSSGVEITEKIGQKLYPFIHTLFQEVLDYNSVHPLQDEETDIVDRFYLLKAEFDSLRNYELKLVFPSVLKVFDSKDKEGHKPTINIAELQSLTQKKEKMIGEYIQQIEVYAKEICLTENHPLHQLLFVFQTSFVEEKKQWNMMLHGWSIGCACFVAAQQANTLAHNH